MKLLHWTLFYKTEKYAHIESFSTKTFPIQPKKMKTCRLTALKPLMRKYAMKHHQNWLNWMFLQRLSWSALLFGRTDRILFNYDENIYYVTYLTYLKKMGGWMVQQLFCGFVKKGVRVDEMGSVCEGGEEMENMNEMRLQF